MLNLRALTNKVRELETQVSILENQVFPSCESMVYAVEDSGLCPSCHVVLKAEPVRHARDCPHQEIFDMDVPRETEG